MRLIEAKSRVNLFSNLRLRLMRTEKYYTDRKYRSHLPLKEHNSSHTHHSKQCDQTKTCFICKKSGCWSSRHTEEERANSKMNYRNKFNKEADRHYHRYVVECEGLEDDNLSDDNLQQLSVHFEEAIFNDANFITETGEISRKDASLLITQLSDNSAIHAMLRDNDTVSSDESYYHPHPTTEILLTTQRYDSKQFHGILIDTGAAGKSTAGYNQYLAFNKTFGNIPINVEHKGAVNATFGIGSTISIGSISKHPNRNMRVPYR
ncbi:hypothetical protein K3495_g12652 [Podosphaera aphanis]|nr:hypothetical protein K3495_g12652 [Podosphaera aphanis]